MNEKLDKLIGKLSDLFDSWLGEFEQNPVRTAIKVVIILAVVKYAKKALR
jgi:hypothetical protein